MNNVQFDGRFETHLSVKPSLTCKGSLEARVFGYIKGESVSTKRRSRGIEPSSKSLRTPASDLSLHK